MCLMPGLADGRFLTSNELLSEADATDAACHCTECGYSRRGVLARTLGIAGGLMVGGFAAQRAEAQSAPAPPPPGISGDSVVFLGVMGGPVVSRGHNQFSVALVANGTVYLVDAGEGVSTDIVRAGLPWPRVNHLFLTHHHSDHVAGYAALAMLGWFQQPTSFDRLDVWGPPATREMHRGVLGFIAEDTRLRLALTPQLKPPTKRLHAHNVTLGRTGIKPFFEDSNVRVSATRVFHGSDVPNAYAYRFDIKRTGRVVVFSGDTAPSNDLVALAQDADVLVHEVLSPAGVEQLVATVDPSIRAGIRQHLLDSHTNTTDVVSVAKRSNAKRLALTHYTPGFLPPAAFRREAVAAAAGIGYGGEILAPVEFDTVAV